MAASSNSRPSAAVLAGSTDPSDSDLVSARARTPVQARVAAVVFDLGNVLIAWDPYPAIASAVGTQQATRFLADAEFDFTAWNHQQDAGRSWDEGETAAVTSHPHWESEIRAYRTNFKESLVGAIEDTVQIL